MFGKSKMDEGQANLEFDEDASEKLLIEMESEIADFRQKVQEYSNSLERTKATGKILFLHYIKRSVVLGNSSASSLPRTSSQHLKPDAGMLNPFSINITSPEKKRAQIASEICQSEANYVSQLETLLEV